MNRLLQPFKAYLQWAGARGTRWGKALAYGGPVLALLILLIVVAGGNEESQPLSKEEGSPTATRQLATVVASPTTVIATSTPVAALTATSIPPTPVPPTQPPPTQAPPPAPTQAPAPTSPPPPPASLTITSITSPVRPGQTATLRATTQPSASCSITYTTPAGTVSEAQGLVPKTADSSGNVSWSWVIGTRTGPGTGTVRVTCAGQTATAQIVISS